jgi:hypothetical protein
MVLDDPAHTVEGEALTGMIKPLPTETVTEAVPEQPLEFVPVTE